MNFVPVSLAMQRQGTIQFNKSRSATCTSSSGKDSSGLVQTASGNFHYVSKSVNFGVEHSEQTDGSPSANGSGLSDRSPSESSWEDAKRKGGCVEGPPPRGETRHVYLDMQWTKFGFRLQSYGRRSERGKVQQAFVQNVATGSPAFVAGLRPGDCIIEVNGEDMKYATGDEVVHAIMQTNTKRAHLLVEFVDGAKRLELKKQAVEAQCQLVQKQRQLRALLASGQCQTSCQIKQPRRGLLKSVAELDPWVRYSLRPAINPTDPHPFPYNSLLNSLIVVYSGDVLNLVTDVLVIPISSRGSSQISENAVSRFLRSAGDKVVNELSLAKQCSLGENIVTTGGERLCAKVLYHCVFGNLEEHLISCCSSALSTARTNGHKLVSFWLEGFIGVGVSPQLVLETIRSWLENETNRKGLQRIGLCFHPFPTLLEMVERYFPLDTETIVALPQSKLLGGSDSVLQ